MRTPFLLILGIILLCNSLLWLGAISVAVALLTGKDGERFWCLVLGLILLLGMAPGWWLAGVLSIIFVFTDD